MLMGEILQKAVPLLFSGGAWLA